MKSAQLIELESNGHMGVMISGKTYEIKDSLKTRGYRFVSSPYAHWVRDLGATAPERSILNDEQSFLKCLGVEIS